MIERLTGFLVMLIFSAVGLLFGPLSFGGSAPVIIMLAAVVALLGAVAAVLLAPTALLKLLPSVTERLPTMMHGRLSRFFRRLLRKAQRIIITVARQTRRGHALRRALVLSVPFYFTIFLRPVLSCTLSGPRFA